jgi:Dna[CI] antecedent DciA-like protein
MQPLQVASVRAFQHLLAAQPTTPAKVACAWQLAAGPVLGRACVPHWTEDGTLAVRPRDAAWRREINRARPIIAERLTQLLGPDVVRRLVIESARD